MDAVVIPSLWLETGPLTLFDAQAARLPVIGSRLGGIEEERITHGQNGFLFKAGDPNALAAILAAILEEPEILSRVTKGVQPPRTMSAAAIEYVDLYGRIIAKSKAQ